MVLARFRHLIIHIVWNLTHPTKNRASTIIINHLSIDFLVIFNEINYFLAIHNSKEGMILQPSWIFNMNQPIWQIPLDFLGRRSIFVGWMDTRTVFFPRVQNEQTANFRAIFKQARVCLLNQLYTSRAVSIWTESAKRRASVWTRSRSHDVPAGRTHMHKVPLAERGTSEVIGRVIVSRS